MDYGAPSENEMRNIPITAKINLDDEHSVFITISASEIKRLKTSKLIGKGSTEITVIATLVSAVFDTDEDLFI